MCVALHKLMYTVLAQFQKQPSIKLKRVFINSVPSQAFYSVPQLAKMLSQRTWPTCENISGWCSILVTVKSDNRVNDVTYLHIDQVGRLPHRYAVQQRKFKSLHSKGCPCCVKMPQTATNLDRPQTRQVSSVKTQKCLAPRQNLSLCRMENTCSEMLTFTGVPSIGLVNIWVPNLSVEISQALSVRNQQWHCNNKIDPRI